MPAKACRRGFSASRLSTLPPSGPLFLLSPLISCTVIVWHCAFTPTLHLASRCYWSRVCVALAAHCSEANKQARLVERKVCFLSVQFSCSVMSNPLWPHGLKHARLRCLFTNSWSLLKPMSIESVMPSSHLILCHPLLLPSVFPSIRVFSDESVLHIRWPKYWSFSFSISPSNEYSELIPFRMDWLDLLSVQEQPRVFSNTTVQKHQFFHAQLSL